MHVRMIDSFSATVNGRPVKLSGTQAPRILALLALEWGRPVPHERIQALLWPEGAPATAHRQVSSELPVQPDGKPRRRIVEDRQEVEFSHEPRPVSAPGKARLAPSYRSTRTLASSFACWSVRMPSLTRSGVFDTLGDSAGSPGTVGHFGALGDSAGAPGAAGYFGSLAERDGAPGRAG